MATDWIKGPGGASDPRSIGLVRVGDIVVDQRVQRSIDPSKVDRIATRWDWALAEVLTLVQRSDGKLVATEGQHRKLGLEQRDPDSEIWAVLLPDVDGLGDEAAVALGIAKGRRPHNRVQEWRMRVLAGDAHEVEAERVIESLGLIITDAQSARGIKAAGTVMRLIHGTQAKPLSPQAGAELLRKTLDSITYAIPEESNMAGRRFDAAILRAIGDLVATYPQLNMQRLKEKLSQKTAAQWLAYKASTSPSWRGIRDMVLYDYNRAMKSGKLQ